MLNMTDFEEIVKLINKASTAKQAAELETQDVAYEYAILSSIAEAASAQMKQLSKKLTEDEVDEVFYDLEKKVVIADGSKKYEIDARRLRIDMTKSGRAKEFNSIISIQEKDLKSLEDGLSLVDRYKNYVGTSAPRLKALKLSEEEKAEGQRVIASAKNLLK